MYEPPKSVPPNEERHSLRQSPRLRSQWVAVLLMLSLALIFATLLFFTDETWAALPLPLIVIVISIFMLRYKYGNEVYILWFVFFATLYLSMMIYYFFDAEHVIKWYAFEHLPDLEENHKDSTTARLLLWYFHMSTDFLGEITLVVAISGLLIIPQLLSFAISGLFGCGRFPLLIANIIKLSMITLIKFNCGFAAFAMSAEIFRIHKNSTQSPDDYFDAIFYPTSILALTFALAALHFRAVDLLHFIGNRRSPIIYKKMTAYMTKYTS